MIATKNITVTMNGKRCAGQEGQTILQIARANDVYIPTLCYLENISPWGGCRLCIVEVKGSPKVVPACSTPATDGSEVVTDSPRLHQSRRNTLELLFSERNHICPFCSMNDGDCGLQHQGYLHGIESIRYPYLYPSLPVDTSARYFALDHNRCILCTRCIRTCDEIEGAHALDVSHRGIKNRVVVDLGLTFGQSDTCTNCGACVAACPTGALFDKASSFRGKLHSCQTTKTTCIECPVGCGLMVYAKENRIVNVFGDPDAPVNRGHLCVRGRYETWAEPHERITQPLVRLNGKLTAATWEEATRAITGAAKKLKPGQKALLVSPRLTNEAAAVVGKIAAGFDACGVFVAKNEMSLGGRNGDSADSVTMPDDIRNADAIILLGTQPSRTHGLIAAQIRTAVRKRGAKLIIFHARKSDLDQYADIAANVVSLERSFWRRASELLQGVQRPVLLYGPNAMTPVGITVMERLNEIFKTNSSGGALRTMALPISTNATALAAAGAELLEEVGPWIGERPLQFLHIVAGDEPDGGERLMNEKFARALLKQIGCVVVQAAYRSPLSDLASVVLPAATWSEKSGTITNLEGRSLALHAALPPLGEARDDKAILEALYL